MFELLSLRVAAAALALKRKLSFPVSRLWHRCMRWSSRAIVIIGVVDDGHPFDEADVRRYDDAGALVLVWRCNWQTRLEVEVALFECIDGFCNPRRKHSAVGWKSPVAFEHRAA